jgi:methylated-DNA-[protein]-cysteine S-methyltransferase
LVEGNIALPNTKSGDVVMPLCFYATPLGQIGIEEQQGAIVNVYFADEAIPSGITLQATGLTDEAGRQLAAYCQGQLKQFDLPLAPLGTPFQQRIWQLLCQIPYGTTWSYKQLAIAAGNPNAMRAVGQANNKNPIPIFIPCHRVIGVNGQLVGYGGGLAIKQQLLVIEQPS